MTGDSLASSAPHLTIDDVRHHAEEVRDMALDQVKRITEADTTRVVIIGAVVVVGLLSLAYMIGSHSHRER